MILKRGEFVWLANEKQRIKAMVTLASPNGDSLMVMFDAMFWMSEGGYAGMMALLRESDGKFYDLMGHEPIEVSRSLEEA